MMSDIRTKVALNRHLPLELCREILSRLPVKSLLRFRCVSKSWLTLINDPEFCRLHLKNFKNNRDETHLLVVQVSPQDCVVSCSDTFESSTGTLRSLEPWSSGGSWTIRCINRLVLLEYSYRRNSGWAYRLIVWNPSIRKSRDIPSSPEIETSDEAEIGFGYDPLVKDYKYVKLILKNPNIPPMVAIYTLGIGSWKIIQFQGKGSSNFEWDTGIIDGEAVCLRGSLYFLALHLETDVLEMVSFDMSSEVFYSISLPDGFTSVNDGDYPCVTLVRYGCSSLALFDFEDHTSMCVWESESMCWTEPYSMDLVIDDFLYLNKNRDILMWWCDQEVSYSLATTRSFDVCCNLVSSYNLETREEKVLLLEKGDLEFEISKVYGYIESLLLLK